MEKYLKSKVIGQEQICESISKEILHSEIGPNRGTSRPKNSFLLLGPTGVGKTSMVLAIKEFLYKNKKDKFASLDMAEFQQPDSIGLLIGTSFENQGILGNIIDSLEDGGVILFDEIEKANKNVVKILLSILDQGHITMSNGQKKLLNKHYLFFTSNLGCNKIPLSNRLSNSMIQKIILKAAQDYFSPELMSRFKNYYIFNSLSIDSQINILKKVILNEKKLWEKHLKINISLNEDTLTPFIMNKIENKRLGARPFVFTVEKVLGQFFTTLKLNSPKLGDIFLDIKNDKIIYKNSI